MESSILLSNIQILDIFCRFAAVGAFFVHIAFVVNGQNSSNTYARLSLAICIIAYIILTAPIEDAHYGWLRPVLLLLTDCTSYALLCVYWGRVKGRSIVESIPNWALFILGGWFVWLGYFFLAKQGQGVFHDFHHVFGLLLLVFIFVDAIRGFSDDLVESRRDTRKVIILAISAYMTALILVELVIQPLKDNWLFSLTNSLVILAFSLFFTRWCIKQTINATQAEKVESKQPGELTSPVFSTASEKLKVIMQEGAYTRNGLTVAALANEVSMPEYQLRSLINKELGFENFSQFLNSYRIPAIAKRLENPSDAKVPVLTLALDNGYSSIAPFNRAFKSAKGITPTEYRRNFLTKFQK